jgi:hypothetical protein
MKDERLILLIDAYLDGALALEEKAELERMLLESDAARRQFWQRTSLHGWSHAAAKMNYGASPIPARQPKTKPNPYRAALEQAIGWVRWVRRHAWATGLATACVAALAGWYVMSRPMADDGIDDFDLADETPDEAATVRSVAMLTHGASLVWDDEKADLEIGAQLQPGPLRLKSGVAEIEFYNGARLVLEGPAEMELISPMEVRLQSGKLKARVPEPAHGFQVHLNDGATITDLGTEFGVNEVAAQVPQVHVFQGKVEVAVAPEAKKPVQLLIQGQSVEVQANEIHPMALTPAQSLAQFVDENEVARREATELKTRYVAWQNRAGKLDADPALRVHYYFESNRTKKVQLLNASRQKGKGSIGTIIGCSWTDGRWPGKKALEFQDTNSAVKFSVPGHLRSLTYMTWILIDDLPNAYNGLAMTDRQRPGGVHWEISRQGKIIFAVRVPTADKKNAWDRVATGNILKPEKRGRWMHLAAVYDGSAGRMSLYVDGKQVASKKTEQRADLYLDGVEIGNWSRRSTTPESIRDIHGRMDEFAVLARPLSAQEIRRQFEIGKPRETTLMASAPAGATARP